MNKIAILTDSASNITENTTEGIFVVPLYVNYGNESKKDLVEITPEELFDKIDDENPSTSAPSIDDFGEKIQMIKEAGYQEIIAVAVSQTLSGTYNAMRLALEDQDLPFKLIDSKTVTMPQGLLVMYARHLINEGHTSEEIETILNNKLHDAKVYATVSDLQYLIRGGRLSKVKGLVGGALKINPILTIDENGEIGKYRSIIGKKRALNFLVDQVKADLAKSNNYYLAIAYGRHQEDIAEIKEQLSELVERADLYLEGPVTAVLGSHSGPSAYVVSYLKK